MIKSYLLFDSRSQWGVFLLKTRAQVPENVKRYISMGPLIRAKQVKLTRKKLIVSSLFTKVEDGIVFHITSRQFVIFLVVYFFKYVSVPTHCSPFYRAIHKSTPCTCINSWNITIQYRFLRLENQLHTLQNKQLWPPQPPWPPRMMRSLTPKPQQPGRLMTSRQKVSSFKQLTHSSSLESLVAQPVPLSSSVLHHWRRLFAKIDDGNATEELWPTAQKAQLLKFIMGIQVF